MKLYPGSRGRYDKDAGIWVWNGWFADFLKFLHMLVLPIVKSVASCEKKNRLAEKSAQNIALSADCGMLCACYQSRSIMDPMMSDVAVVHLRRCGVLRFRSRTVLVFGPVAANELTLEALVGFRHPKKRFRTSTTNMHTNKRSITVVARPEMIPAKTSAMKLYRWAMFLSA